MSGTKMKQRSRSDKQFQPFSNFWPVHEILMKLPGQLTCFLDNYLMPKVSVNRVRMAPPHLLCEIKTSTAGLEIAGYAGHEIKQFPRILIGDSIFNCMTFVPVAELLATVNRQLLCYILVSICYLYVYLSLVITRTCFSMP